MNPFQVYKIVLIGPGGVGKSAFVERLKNNSFSGCYVATLGVEVNSIQIPDMHFTCNIWDCAGDPNFAGLGDGYYVNADAAIVMIDASAPNIIQTAQFVASFRHICPEAPIFYVYSKVDVMNCVIPQIADRCSSKTGEGCAKFMRYVATALNL